MFGKKKEKEKEVKQEKEVKKTKEEELLDPPETEPRVQESNGSSEVDDSEIDYGMELANLAVEYKDDEKLLLKLTEALLVKCVSEVSELRYGLVAINEMCGKLEVEKVALKERCKYLQSVYNRDCLKEID